MTKTRFNPAVSQLGVPAIPQAASWANNYDGRYGKLIDFSQAVPDFVTHKTMLAELAARAGATDSTGYGNIEGEPTLRNAYARHVTELYKQEITPNNIHITSGCNQAFVAALIALAGSGDSVVVCNPCYFNHESTARMLGISLKYVNCLATNNFQPALKALEASIDDSVRAIALVSPNNPTGAIYSPQKLQEIFTLCQQRGIWLILDETYRDFMDPRLQSDRQHSVASQSTQTHSAATLSHQSQSSNHPTSSINSRTSDYSIRAPHDLFGMDNWQNTLIQLYSFSKSLSIPGHRLGAITAGIEAIEMIAKVMDNIQICAPRAAQLAVANQLLSMQDWIATNAATLSGRSDIFRTVINKHPNWKIRSMGAYFAYVEHPFSESSSLNVAKSLAENYGVLTLPGGFFGQHQEGYLRVAFANANSDMVRQLGDRLTEVNTHSILIA